MPDTKMDEAIALARRIVDRGLRQHFHDGTLAVAQALLDATSPGAQYRAGMERALEIAERNKVGGLDAPNDAYSRGYNSSTITTVDTIRAAITALPASPPDLAGAYISDGHTKFSAEEHQKIGERFAAALPASPEPVMPELWWKDDCLTIGGIIVGRLTREDWPEFDNSNGQPCRHSRTAVEAAVRERLTALPAPTTEEQHG